MAGEACNTARISGTTTQAITSNTRYNNLTVTDHNIGGVTVSATGITITEEGIYEISGYLNSVRTASGSGSFGSNIYVNGTSVARQATSNIVMGNGNAHNLFATMPLSVGDVIEIWGSCSCDLTEAWLSVARIDCGSGSGTSTGTDTLYVASEPCSHIRIEGASDQNNATSAAYTHFNTTPIYNEGGLTSNASGITIDVDGWYQIVGQMSAARNVSANSYNVGARVVVNGVEVAFENETYPNTTNSTAHNITTYQYLSAGDVVSLWSNNTQSVLISASRTFLEVHRIDCGGGSGSSTPQTLSYDPATDSLTISGGNTVSIAPQKSFAEMRANNLAVAGPAGSSTVVNLNAAPVDQGVAVSTDVPGNQITISEDGYYRVSASMVYYPDNPVTQNAVCMTLWDATAGTALANRFCARQETVGAVRRDISTSGSVIVYLTAGTNLQLRYTSSLAPSTSTVINAILNVDKVD
ncbi:MAG: hypothetical protein R2801_00215 [Chitinophagales bacterium]